MEEIKLKLCLFEGNNSGSWKYRMESILDQYELKQFIETDPEELVYRQAATEADKLRKSEKKCKAIINNDIADSQLEYSKGEHMCSIPTKTIRKEVESHNAQKDHGKRLLMPSIERTIRLWQMNTSAAPEETHQKQMPYRNLD
ncbi:hypothetical protein WA026_013889 [Henosepilachna vigintioctopunctata]|uniref:Uncharacterized protein n=1 Tax=Henosepilachna vigintioctopunctata TaxID=420089 RepID=A0AAW1U910_9CUCU